MDETGSYLTSKIKFSYCSVLQGGLENQSYKGLDILISQATYNLLAYTVRYIYLKWSNEQFT